MLCIAYLLGFIFEFGFIQHLLFAWLNDGLHAVVQSVDIIKYTDEEYDKYLTDPVGIVCICPI